MANQPLRRSQALLRIPVDQVSATMTMHDGGKSEVVLFVPGGVSVSDLLTSGDAFIPVIRDRSVALVARAAIAALAVAEVIPLPVDGELPDERQIVVVHLRAGEPIKGELRWLAPVGRQRTADHLNDPTPYIAVRANGVVHLVVKSHIALVEEK
jgi:hypothetical protein